MRPVVGSKTSNGFAAAPIPSSRIASVASKAKRPTPLSGPHDHHYRCREVKEIDDPDLLATVPITLQIDIVERSGPLVVFDTFDDDIEAALGRRHSLGGQRLAGSRRNANRHGRHPTFETRRPGERESLLAR